MIDRFLDWQKIDTCFERRDFYSCRHIYEALGVGGWVDGIIDDMSTYVQDLSTPLFALCFTRNVTHE